MINGWERFTHRNHIKEKDRSRLVKVLTSGSAGFGLRAQSSSLGTNRRPGPRVPMGVPS